MATKKITVDEAVVRIKKMLDEAPLPGKHPAEVSKIGGRTISTTTRVAFGCEVGISVELYPRTSSLKGVGVRTLFNHPSINDEVDGVTARIALLNTAFNLAAIVDAFAHELAEEVDPKTFGTVLERF